MRFYIRTNIVGLDSSVPSSRDFLICFLNLDGNYKFFYATSLTIAAEYYQASHCILLLLYKQPTASRKLQKYKPFLP